MKTFRSFSGGGVLAGAVLLRVAAITAVSAATATTTDTAAQGGVVATHTTKIGPTQPTTFAQFGGATDVSGDTLLVGSAGSVGGGAVFEYTRSPSGWRWHATWTASDAFVGDQFGASVAIEGDFALVAAPAADDHSLNNVGSVYVFARSGADWIEQARIDAPVAEENGLFGTSLAFSGDRALIGSRAQAGSVHVFLRQGASWVREAELTDPNGPVSEAFGESVSLSGDTAVVGANSEDDPSLPGPGLNAGAAWIFVRSGSVWTLQGKLKPNAPQSGAWFGAAVAISGDTIAVGAPGEGAGAAYVFVRNEARWLQQARLSGTHLGSFGWFGGSVDVSGDRIAVGASLSQHLGTEVGEAYVYGRYGESWFQQLSLYPTVSLQDFLHFGLAVALSPDAAVATSPGDSFGAQFSGAAYVVDLQDSPWVGANSGVGPMPVVPASGISVLSGSGPLIAGSSGALHLTGADPSVAGLLLVSLSLHPTPYKLDYEVLALPPLLVLPFSTSASGDWSLAWESWPAGLPPFTVLYFQCVLQTPLPPLVALPVSSVLQAYPP